MNRYSAPKKFNESWNEITKALNEKLKNAPEIPIVCASGSYLSSTDKRCTNSQCEARIYCSRVYTPKTRTQKW